MRSPWWVVGVLWALSAVALAAKKPAAAEAEAGIQVAGTILVGPEGKPLQYELQGAAGLPAEVRRYLDFHIPRAYLYFAMGFSILVETLNMLARRKQARKKRPPAVDA